MFASCFLKKKKKKKKRPFNPTGLSREKKRGRINDTSYELFPQKFTAKSKELFPEFYVVAACCNKLQSKRYSIIFCVDIFFSWETRKEYFVFPLAGPYGTSWFGQETAFSL